MPGPTEPALPGGPAQPADERQLVTVIVIALALSVALAWVNTSAAKYCWLLIPLAPWVANRWAARTPGTGTAGLAGQ
jgi:hypothetical protein